MNIAEELAGHPFCAAMTSEQQAKLANCARQQSFRKGEFLLLQNSQAEAFFLIVEGQVEIKVAQVSPGEAPLETLGAGEAVGWSWYLPPYRWHFDAVACQPTRVIAFDADCLRSLMAKDHDVGYAVTSRLLEVVAQRLQATRLQLSDVYGAA